MDSKDSDSTGNYYGELSGQWRTYYLSTYNKEDLKDYNAIATGGKLKYTYKVNKNFTLGAAVYTTYNFNIQDLTAPDSSTGKISRYEAGLFGLNDLNQRLLGIPGELFVSYKVNSHDFTLGRMKLVTPFFNPQDGRMIPTLAQGFWYKFSGKNINSQLGILNEIGPRSTTKFFTIGNSIGHYPQGRQENGKPSQYYANTDSEFLGIFNFSTNKEKTVSFQLWNFYAENLFNTLYIRPELKLPKNGPILAFEWLRQDRVGHGGNSIDSLRYFTSMKSNIVGVQLSQKIKAVKLSLGYDYILPGGRFLFPREWGREFLFSFQKRERSEGSSDNHALVLYFEKPFSFENHQLKSILSIGKHWKASVLDPKNNKYAIPDYTHINADFWWTHKRLKGFAPELLLTYKMSNGKFPENPNFIHNKVDMFQINLIVNYNF